MVDFTKSLIAGWPGLYHDDPRWNDDKYKVDLDLAYEEISRRLAQKMKVERVAPDRLGVFCDMAEYLYCNYDRFYEMAKNRAAKLRRRWQQEE